MNAIEISPQFKQVLDFVNRTNKAIFLTGKAGSGKTTLLKYIRQNTFKQMAVVAPTGVAAINAGGSTIHSFFQFPFAPFLPVLKDNGEIDQSGNLPVLRYTAQRLAIFRNLELLVIDEISMVRADLLDQVDMALRQTRKKWHLPFGGVQLLLIGDMYQLSPVVQSEEWSLLNAVYPSVFFFDSLVMRRNPPVYIELEKIYRQSDEEFITLLNKVRNNRLDKEALTELNARFKANITKQEYLQNTTLTTHNRKADEINLRNLGDLKGKEYVFKCKVDGSFSEKAYPADENLTLKEGTRVMFVKNNPEKNYYNGKIGIVSFIDENKICVRCEEDNSEIEVTRETWTNVSYKVDKATKHIDEEILGTFVQYPLRLAWAITIHKSQGLTFDKLIIDAAESFSAGQVYVALSRCRSLQGLILSSRISSQSLVNDAKVIGFAEAKQDPQQLKDLFHTGQQAYTKTVLLELFDLTELHESCKDLAGTLQLYKQRVLDAGNWFQSFKDEVEALNEVSVKFRSQLSALIDRASHVETDPGLQQRLKQAAVYFEAQLKKNSDCLRRCSFTTESKEAATEINELLQQMFEIVFSKHAMISTLLNGFVFSDFVKSKLSLTYPGFKLNIYATSKNTKVSAEVRYPDLFRKLLLLRDEICNEEQKPIYMVANNKTLTELTNFLPGTPDQLLKISGFGEAKVEAFGHLFLKLIKEYMSEHNLETRMEEMRSGKTKKPKKEQESKPKKLNTKEQTYLLYRQGLSMEEIAKQRGFTVSTVQAHLIPYIASGEIMIDDLVSKKKQALILKALEQFNYEEGLNPIKSKLPEDISFNEIRYVMAHRLRD